MKTLAGSDNQSMAVGNDEQISKLMETAGRLRTVRAAERRFLMLWAADHPEALLEETERAKPAWRDDYHVAILRFLTRATSRWNN